jgi:hypothetical protein
MYAKSPGTNLDNAVQLLGESDITTSDTNYLLTGENGLDQLVTENLVDSFVYYDTILDNPIEGYRFNDDNTLDMLNFIFPCEESLIQPIIDLCLKEIGVTDSIPRDVTNNAFDDLGATKQQQQQQN